MTKQKKDPVKEYQKLLNEEIEAESRVDMNTYIPGTKIPKKFYCTVKLDMEKLLEASVTEWDDIVKIEFNSAKFSAIQRIQQYRARHRVFKYCGADPGDGFVMDLNYAWCTTDDGVIQLLRLDMIPLGMRCIDAEIDFLDGKLEEVVEDGVSLLKPVEKNAQ